MSASWASENGQVSTGQHTYKLMSGGDGRYDLVMGNRFAGGILPGAMPPLHRYLGNPVLTWVGRLFFRSPLRGFSREAVERLNLRTTGMEFASEMVVKASLFGLRVAEVPVTLSPDGRSRPPPTCAPGATGGATSASSSSTARAGSFSSRAWS